MKIGFIGAGNMGGALAKAAARTENTILLADASHEKAAALAAKIGAGTADNHTVSSMCDCIFLGVKPQVLPLLIDEIRDVLKKRTTPFFLVSMAAGVTIGKIVAMLGFSVPIIRIMQNTPVSVGRGMILWCGNDLVTAENTAAFTGAMRFAGTLDEIPENLIDAGCALSGCGPAFVALFIEALADGAVACGLPRAKALLYAAETVGGTAALLSESGQHPGELKDAVCSPAGSTVMGVAALEAGGFRAAAIDAVLKAYARTKELGK